MPCTAVSHSMVDISLSVSPNSDKSGKQSLYPDDERDHHQNLIICSLAHCQPSLKISCKSPGKFLHKVLKNRQMDNDDYIYSLAQVISLSVTI